MASPTDTLVEAQSGQLEDEKERLRVAEFLRLAKSRFKLAAEAETRIRQAALDDLKFLAGEQWPQLIQTQRDNDGRPCLTINRLPQFKRQITNEQRQQRPAIQVNPVGDGADEETAEIFQGIIRHIEVNSDAEIAYDTAFEMAVICGFGYFTIGTEYLDERSFDQEICIRRVKNPFTWYVDPSSIEPTYCDMDWAFEVEDVPIDEYKRDYKESAAASLTDFTSIGDASPEWATKDTIKVANYWHVEYNPVTICLLADGTVMRSGEVPAGATILKRREVQERKVVCSKINAIEILDDKDWLGAWIPLIPVLADDFDIDGRRHLAGIVRDAKDPQRMYNYWVSSGTEMIALAPRAPFVGAEGQFEGHEAMWQNANVKNYPYLEYKLKEIGGTAVPPPARQAFEPPVQAITLMTRQADSDLKAVVGIYDPTLGQPKSDQSGKAITQLQRQSDVGHLNFSDNLSRSIRWAGKVLLDLIPKIYDAPRAQRIINPDGSTDTVGIHGQLPQGMTPEQMPQMEGIEKIYDISQGRYDVTVSVGPSYQTKRQESVASILALVSSYPQIIGIAGDLLLGQMDWPMAKQIAERLKKALPPQLQDDQTDKDAQLQRAQAQVQQLSQSHDLLVKALNEVTETMKSKQMELAANEKLTRLKLETQLAIAEIDAKTQEMKVRADYEHKVWSELHGSAHELALQKDQQTADLEQIKAQPQPENGAQPNA